MVEDKRDILLEELTRLEELRRGAPETESRSFPRLALRGEAEVVARNAGHDAIAVTSGVGVRSYYSERGYALDGMYMVKDL